MFKMTRTSLAVLLLASAPLAMGIATPALAASQQQDMAAQLDALAAPYFKPDQPGAALLVAKDGKVLLRKAYGLADVAKQQPLTPDTSFRIGSLAKQFTAVAIMMLVEEGKLSVSDKLTKHLPQMPEHGITVEHLLTHTSGIPNYSTKAGFRANMAKDKTLDDMIEVFRNEQLDFAPGTRFNYSNSGYLLLGAMIEKLSGQDYGSFLKARIFTPLDMRTAAYGDNASAGIARATGYAREKGKTEVAAPLSMSQVHAAGALTATVDDMLKWDNAVRTGKLLKAESWKQMFSPFKLNAGNLSPYAYGWEIEKLRGHPSISHTGGINGFSAFGLRLPQQGVYVVALGNLEENGPVLGPLVYKAAALAAGDPFPNYQRVTLTTEQLDACIGVYKADGGPARIIRREGEGLTMQRGNGARVKLFAHGENAFHMEHALAHLEFKRDAAGKVQTLLVHQEDGSALAHARTSDTPPPELKAISLAPGVFERYVGRYQLGPRFILDISREGDSYFAQATGQPRFEIFAKSETEFFPKVVEAVISFEKDEQGKVTGLSLRQGGRSMPAKRLD